MSIKLIAPALALASLAACTTAPAPQAALTPKEARQLAAALEGKVPGKPVSCVSTFRSSNLRAIGERTLVYRVNRNLTYRNDLVGACRGLRYGDTLVMRVYGSQYCRGDIAHSIDLNNGMLTGVCSLGDFVPYTTPDKK